MRCGRPEQAQPYGEGGEAPKRAFPGFAGDRRGCAEAALAQRAPKAPPY